MTYAEAEKILNYVQPTTIYVKMESPFLITLHTTLERRNKLFTK